MEKVSISQETAKDAKGCSGENGPSVGQEVLFFHSTHFLIFPLIPLHVTLFERSV